MYLDFSSLHGTHGRAIAFATGIKMANPELTVIVITGDGDALAIGGNHLIHACRRNIDLTVVLVNNFIYGMTGGQVSPTTPEGSYCYTAPYGNFEPSFDAVKLATGAGATFVARTSTYHVFQMANFLKKAIEHKGLSLVDIMSQCPVLYGRLNKYSSPVSMVKWFKEHSVPIKSAEKKTAEELQGKFITGVFKDDVEAPEYSELYWNLIRRLSEPVAKEE